MNEAQAREEAVRLFPERISEAVRDSIVSPGDPVALQYVADPRELIVAPEERTDPIGDRTHSPVKGIVHRHPDRVLLKAASVCSVHCRFCFRKTMLGQEEETLSDAEMGRALDYVAQSPSVREVILTGGDPLVLSVRRIAGIFGRLDAIAHVKCIRIHSRVPVADPARVTPALCALMERVKPVYIVVHVNHAQELTDAAVAALRALRRGGAVLLSQSVLLKGVNDDARVLEELFLRLVELRVKPYYLHHPDLVPGTGHFRVSIARGRELMRALRALVSGLAVPSYVLDIPGGYGKVPLEAEWAACAEDGTAAVCDHRGTIHAYPGDLGG